MQTEIALSDRELDELFAANASYNMRIELPASPSHSSAPSSPALSAKGDLIPLPEGVVPQRCGYRTGKCTNLQAVKRNGKLHKLCEFHREKANQNQKKLDRKKRQLRFSPYDAHNSSDDESCSVSSMMDHYSPRSMDEHHRYEAFAPHPTSLHEAPLALAGEELAFFYNIMTFDASQMAAYARPHTVTPPYAHHQPLHHHAHHHHAQFSIV